MTHTLDFQPNSYRHHLVRTVKPTTSSGNVLSYEIGKEWTIGICADRAAREAAELIYQSSEGSNICIPLSGGIDSESVARIFLKIGIPFTPVIMKFVGGLNDFDTTWAFKLCKDFGLTPTVLDLDLEGFYESGLHLAYAERYNCRSPQLATHLWMMDHVSGHFIFPYNPLPLLATKRGKMYIGCPEELHLCYDRYFDVNARTGTGLFYLYTPDLIYSFLQDSLFLNMLFDSERHFRLYTSDHYVIKSELYNRGGIPVQMKRSKFTGFEVFREKLNKKYDWKEGDYYNHHYRTPMEKISNDPKYMAIGNFELEKLYDIWSKS